MLGWEFPPYSTGGLGTACYGITKGLSTQGVDVTFVLPTLKENVQAEFVKLIGANIKIVPIDSPIVGYMTSEGYHKFFSRGTSSIYGQDLFKEVYRFSKRVAEIAMRENFDVIHAHDWMTYPAGINAKEITKKPLVIHVHATEFDRSANNNVNQIVYDIEKMGMHMADSIIAVSNFTKNKITTYYGIDQSKVNVVHNAVEINDYSIEDNFGIKKEDKIVLFLGRITVQKGPDYFLYTAKRILEQIPNVKFVIAGSGDMETYIINKAAELGLSKHILFTGFLRGKDVDRVYRMADVYVMPSVSEPFGITPLEAMANNTPVVISKQSGVSEVIKNCLKVDFWDINELTNKIVSILKYPPLAQTLKENASFEVRQFNWNEPAKKCIDVYNQVLVSNNG